MKKSSYTFLEQLIARISPSGYEEDAARLWREEAATFAAEVRSDTHGNSVAVVGPGGAPRVMLSGHIDEIGFLVSHIDEKGFLWVAPIGGWDPQIVQGQRVQIRGRKGIVRGVIGKCPVHLLKEDARNKVVKIDDMWVDIGARDRKDAEKAVSVGDPMVLAHALEPMRGSVVAGRGLDDRAGAWVVLEAARQLAASTALRAEVHTVATVQEELGLRGARTSAFGIDPQVGIAVDVTFATDHPSMGHAVRREGEVKLGAGAVITRGPNINPKLFELLVDTARREKIPHQVIASARPTGTDANAMQINRAGVATGLLSIPLRYMHSACELVNLKDMDACARLIARAVARITPETVFLA